MRQYSPFGRKSWQTQNGELAAVDVVVMQFAHREEMLCVCSHSSAIWSSCFT